jgi:enoyl-CoA hydratase/carnithine racemase
MLTGRRVEAREAVAFGLVSKAVPSADLESELQRTVLDFLAAGPEAQRRTKELLKRALPLPGPEHIDFTAEAIARARSSPEGRKGLEAFFAKAPPAWAARVEALRKSSQGNK